MITIDGSHGEGGGQILRTSLALSLVTGQPFRIKNIRSRRKKPGLMRQHLTAVTAAVEVGQAEAKGASLGSQELCFAPKAVQPGTYHFSVGTAGSTTLVLQTVLPALLIAHGPSRVLLEGGTHNPFAPPFDFLKSAFLPLINRMGPRVSAGLERPGFFPAGGGRIAVSIEPAPKLAPVNIQERGSVLRHEVRAIAARLPRTICDREIGVIRDLLGWERSCFRSETVTGSQGPGNVVTIEIESDYITEVFTAFGEKGLPAEKVPLPMVEEVRRYLAAGVPVGVHLADQLMIPLAMAGHGSYRTLALSRHSTTNCEVIHQFLAVKIAARTIRDDDVVISFSR